MSATIYNCDGLVVRQAKTESGGLRLVFEFDKPEAKGTLILDECGYGLHVCCPDIHPEQPVALLDLFYPSPEGQENPGGPPLQIEIYTPAQVDDPVCQARFFPAGTQVRFEPGIVDLANKSSAEDKVFGVSEDGRPW